MKTTAITAIAVLAAAAGFGIYRYTVQAPTVPAATNMPVAAPAASGGPAGPQTDAPADSGMPELLPEFTLADLEGAPRSIRSWPGKSMIVNFWATWCAPCRREIPLLKELQQRHGPEGFQVVGVAVDFRDDVVKYAKDIGIDYPVLVGEEDGFAAISKFGQGSLGFPFTVFTDNQQRIVLFHLGEIKPADADVLLEAVNRVNRGELSPTEARMVAAKQLAELPKSPAES